MKKTLLFVVLFGVVGSLLLAGCEKKQETPPVPTPSTNAPAAQ